jgi:hypothetical protein
MMPRADPIGVASAWHRCCTRHRTASPPFKENLAAYAGKPSDRRCAATMTSAGRSVAGPSVGQVRRGHAGRCPALVPGRGVRTGRLYVGQLSAGSREHRWQCDSGVLVVEQGESCRRLAKLTGERVKTEFGSQLCSCGENAQRQRKPAALGQHFLDRRGFGSQPLRTQPVDQCLPTLSRGENVHRQRMRAVGRDQPQQPVPAGDEDRTRVRTGEQWYDLAGIAGIVQYDQYPPAGSATPRGINTKSLEKPTNNGSRR